jgi:small subunit ribosomal protein S1
MFFKRREKIKVKILSVDNSKKILGLGIREFEDSPWDILEKTFKVDTIHKGTILKEVKNGCIVSFNFLKEENAEQLEVFIPQKELITKDKKTIKEGDVLDYLVINFIKEEEKIFFSHIATHSKNKKIEKVATPSTTKFTPKASTTLADLAAMSVEENSKNETKQKVDKKDGDKKD